MQQRFASIAILAIAGCATAPPPPISVGEFIAQKEGLSVAEGERRAEHQNAIHALVAQAGKDPAWGGLRFEHRPEYRIILRFADGRARPELLALVPADLRSHIRFGTALRSLIEVDRLTKELFDALRPLPGDWNTMYDDASGRFTVNVARSSQLDEARRLVPTHLQAHTDVVVGGQIIPT
jgi:hypothetical protein